MDEKQTPEQFEYEKKSNSMINIKKLLIWIVPIIVIIIVVFMFINHQSGTDDSELASLISKADKSFRQKEYLKAKEDYEAALLIDPSDSHAIKRVGLIDSLLTFREEERIKEISEKEIAPSGKPEKESEEKKDQPVEKIEKAEGKIEPDTETESATGDRYHIVLGCFEVESNAVNYSRKLKGMGYDSRIFPILEGRMKAVTCRSFETEEEAFKKLRQIQKDIKKDAWVLEK